MQLLGGTYHFDDSQNEDVFHQRDLIQLFPYGVSVAADLKNTFFFLKDQSQKITMSVLVNPVEAGLILANLNLASEVVNSQPHGVLQQVLELMDIHILQCVFVQIKGNRQWVRLYLNGLPKAHSLKVPADQAMSLCIALKVPIFATQSFINQSKVIQVQIEGLTKNLIQNQNLLLKKSSQLQ